MRIRSMTRGGGRDDSHRPGEYNAQLYGTAALPRPFPPMSDKSHPPRVRGAFPLLARRAASRQRNRPEIIYTYVSGHVGGADLPFINRRRGDLADYTSAVHVRRTVGGSDYYTMLSG